MTTLELFQLLLGGIELFLKHFELLLDGRFSTAIFLNFEMSFDIGIGQPIDDIRSHNWIFMPEAQIDEPRFSDCGGRYTLQQTIRGSFNRIRRREQTKKPLAVGRYVFVQHTGTNRFDYTLG